MDIPPRLANPSENPRGYEVHPDKPGSNTYYVQGCRCDACKWDHADAQARGRKARSERLHALPQTAHGSASTYTNWWCRDCPGHPDTGLTCLEAYVEDRRVRRAARS